MKEYLLSCNCGLQLKLEYLPSTYLKLSCQRCQNTLLLQENQQVLGNFREITNEAVSPSEKTAAYGQGQPVAAKVSAPVNQPTVLEIEELEATPTPAPEPVAPPQPAVLAQPPASTVEGKIIDQYVIIKKIGEGGMGKVFLAEDQKTHEKVVIKTLITKELEDERGKKLLSYFIREAQILCALEHNYIVKYKGTGNYAGYPYLVMEYIEGERLEDIVRQGPMKLSQAIPILYHLAEALEYAEQVNIVHRDIKPANVILLGTDKKIPKLIDFGLAKSLGEELYALTHFTKTGERMGSPFYMPPEQVEDAKRATHRSDIYALGATFYHMLAGKPPFFEHANPTQRGLLLRAISEGKFTPLSQVRLKLPGEIYQIAEKTMAFSPAKRYAAARELKGDLDKFLQKINGKQ